ncbi:MAG: caspase family protein [Candidatus Melainabacteria bacterium]|nr:caspase family protein [Candidatus Melainabacteria bacterium]
MFQEQPTNRGKNLQALLSKTAWPTLLLCLHCCFSVPPAHGKAADKPHETIDNAEKGLYRVQPPLVQAEPRVDLSNLELATKLEKISANLASLSSEMQKAMQEHLRLAGNYDAQAFALNDERLSEIFEQYDANILDWRSVAQAMNLTAQDMQSVQENLRVSKIFANQSSAIFHLCFGQPLQSAHCSGLALAMARCHPKYQQQQFLPAAYAELLFYHGVASLWSADYDNALKSLQAALENQPVLNFTGESQKSQQDPAPRSPAQVSQSTSLAAPLVDLVYYYLAEISLARRDFTGAKALLEEARKKTGPTGSAHMERSLALTYVLLKDRRAQEQIKIARQALTRCLSKTDNTDQGAITRALLLESLGIVEALAGNYALAAEKLTEAHAGLSVSPLKMGNKLEAEHCLLWRSYCRYKAGDQEGADRDRQAAMEQIDEANHFAYLARNLDQIFAVQNRPLPTQNAPQNRFAVVIGLSNFRDEKIPRLRYSGKDAGDVAKFLQAEAGFAESNIKLLLDDAATRRTILDTISDWLPAKARAGDIVFIFISSHGTPTYGEIGALNSVVTYDTNLGDLELFSTSLPMQKLLREVRAKLKKQRTFIVLDTCYAGGLGAPDGATSANIDPDLIVNSNLQLLLSSSETNERSWESKRYPNSVFTRQLIEALRGNLRYQDFHDIFAAVRKNVQQEVASDRQSKQTPAMAGKWTGQGLATDR